MKTIVITGPSGSGKTILANKLYKDLKNTIVIKTDSYYRDNLLIKLFSLFSKDIYDRIISIKNKEIIKTIKSINNNEGRIILYNYEFKSRKSTKLIKTNKNHIKFLIVEGIFAHRLNLNYKKTINILCQENKEICYQRRLKRDELERGRLRQEVDRKFTKSWNLFFKHLTNPINKYLFYRINTIDKFSYTELITNIYDFDCIKN
tara:strand:- start:216 stop:827 length:612 start_codon:yes stop_codon:yes gene_type:complete